MISAMREHLCGTFDEATQALVLHLASLLRAHVAAGGRAVFATGGGRTPLAVLPRLAASECPWSRVIVTLTDERRVAADDLASNEGLVRRLLLQGPAALAGFVGLCDVAAPPPQADVVYLGFGEDGHVASLFPSGPELAANHLGLVESKAPAPPVARLSLTLPSLLAASRIVLLVSGPGKHAVYTRAKVEVAEAQSPLARILSGDGPEIDVFVSDD